MIPPEVAGIVFRHQRQTGKQPCIWSTLDTHVEREDAKTSSFQRNDSNLARIALDVTPTWLCFVTKVRSALLPPSLGMHTSGSGTIAARKPECRLFRHNFHFGARSHFVYMGRTNITHLCVRRTGFWGDEGYSETVAEDATATKAEIRKPATMVCSTKFRK